MFTLLLLFVLGSFLGHCQGDVTRSVLRSGDSGTVNLVELDIRGVTYGKCSFNNHHTEIEVLYEDRGGEILARPSNPTVLDPLTQVKMCREAATKAPTVNSKLRTTLGDKEHSVEAQPHMERRLSDLQTKLSSNQAYISNLQSRFVFPFSSSTSTNTFGNIATLGVGTPDSFLGALSALGVATSGSGNDFSLGFGFPFKPNV